MPRRHVRIATQDGVADAYFGWPTGVGPVPAVLVYSDAFGLRPELERLGQQLVDAGYAVLIPNLYYRSGPDPVGELPRPIDLSGRPGTATRIRTLMSALDEAANVRDAAAYLSFLEVAPEVSDGPVAVTGYCMGSRIAFQAAESHPGRVAALAAFHGVGLATDAPDSPHLRVASLRAEVYLAHADHDENMPPAQIARLDAALDDAGVVHRTEVYRDARHGYAFADTPGYRADAAQRHLAELVDLLGRNLRG